MKTTEPITHAGYRLLHEGTEELARIESNGIRIDVPLLIKTKENLKELMRTTMADLEKDQLWKDWRKRFGTNMNLRADDQKRFLIYDLLKIPKTRFTEKGNASVDDEVLQNVDHPFVKKLIEWGKYDKGLGTFLKGIEWELVGDRIHPNFHLDTVQTFRSSSSEPNFQNFPVRDKYMAKLIRSLFIASPQSVLQENDFKGIEVGISACYHQDPVFIEYLSVGDMHRDMAAQCYMLEDRLDNWTFPTAKEIRYGAKNKFVFPEFYGAYWKQCAKDLWEWIAKGKLKAPDGRSLYEHLKDRGIKELGRCKDDEDPRPGTFEHHIKEVEKDFWQNRFRVYNSWKKEWWEAYQANGYFDLFTGMRIRGVYNRKQVCNYPIQGTAFHCLLWSLIQINRTLRKYRMKSLLVGQIHDSLLGDVRESELRDYLCIAEEVVTVKMRKHFEEWLRVPLEIEYEMAPPGRPWNDKKEYKFKRGQFKHPEKEVWTANAAAFLSTFGKK